MRIRRFYPMTLEMPTHSLGGERCLLWRLRHQSSFRHILWPRFLRPSKQSRYCILQYIFNKYKTFSVLIHSYINTSVETRCPESFYTILSFPNFHECWYNWVYQYGKKFYYLFYNIAQRNIKEEMFRRFRVDIELYYTIGTYCENSLNNSWGKHKEKS
jgi:hypothetical protein